MSAFVSICCESKIVVLSDTAHYTNQGTLVARKSKIHAIEGMRAVLTARGKAGTVERLLKLVKPRANTFDELCARLPDAARRLFESAWAKEQYREGRGFGCDMALAGWSESSGQPLVFKIYNAFSAEKMLRDGHGPQIAFALTPGKSCAQFGMSAPDEFPDMFNKWLILANAGYMPKDSFVPKLAIPLFEAARSKLKKPTDGGTPYAIIGGEIEQVTITRDGITRSIVHDWPGDVVGDKIATAPEYLLSAYDDSETALGTETGVEGGVTQGQQAIVALAEIARYINAAETDVAAATASEVFDTPQVNKRVTGTDVITGLGTGIGTRFIHWAAASALTYNAVSLITRGGVSRVNIADSYSIWKSDGINVREIYYSGDSGSSGGSNGGGRNYIDNPSFDVWQRATSFALAAATRTQIADRWKAYRSVTGSTISRQTGFSGSQYCIRVQRDNGNTSAQTIRLFQQLLPPIPEQLQGKTVRVSFDVRAGANYSGTVLNVAIATGTLGGEAAAINETLIASLFATGGTGTAVSVSVTPSTTPQRVVCDALALGSTIKDLCLRIQYGPSGTAGAADYIEITNVKLEVGSVATAFEQADPSADLAACQRACYVCSLGLIGITDDDNASIWVSGVFPVPMRVAPTAAITSVQPSARVAASGTTVTAAGSAFSSTTLSVIGFYGKINGFTHAFTGNFPIHIISDGSFLFDADILN